MKGDYRAKTTIGEDGLTFTTTEQDTYNMERDTEAYLL